MTGNVKNYFDLYYIVATQNYARAMKEIFKYEIHYNRVKFGKWDGNMNSKKKGNTKYSYH